jgi:Bacterial PH domain
VAENEQQTSTDAAGGGAGVPPNPTAVFRIPRTSYFAIAFLIFCMTPAALGEIHWLAVLYLIPIALLAFVRRTRTTADSEGLQIRTMFGGQDLPWSGVKGLSLSKKSKVSAVLANDSRVALPTVRTRHLPVLSLVSGGLLPDPSGLIAPPAAPAREPANATSDSGASAQE